MYNVSFILVDHFQIVHTFSWGKNKLFQLDFQAYFLYSDLTNGNVKSGFNVSELLYNFFFNAILLSQDLNFNAEYFIGLRHTGKKKCPLNV